MESYFRVLPSAFSLTCGAILEELSNQRRSKKIGDDEKTKETDPTCCRDSGTKERKVEKATGEGSCQARYSNC